MDTAKLGFKSDGEMIWVWSQELFSYWCAVLCGRTVTRWMCWLPSSKRCFAMATKISRCRIINTRVQASSSFFLLLLPMVLHPWVGLDLFFFFSRFNDRTHLDTPHSVRLLWTSDQPDAETSAWRRDLYLTTYNTSANISYVKILRRYGRGQFYNCSESCKRKKQLHCVVL
jgi:hypothetical protein